MITFTRGNIFDAQTDAAIIPTNARGPMGAGLAKQFRDRFPGLEGVYKEQCSEERVLGRALSYEVSSFNQGFTTLFCLSTKDHWKDPSRWEWIESGLLDIAQFSDLHLSIAVPPLGCGLGGLDWGEVKPKLVAVLETMPEIDWVIYEP